MLGVEMTPNRFLEVRQVTSLHFSLIFVQSREPSSGWCF